MTNQEHALLFIRANAPEFEQGYTFTEVSEDEYIIEWPENRKIIKWNEPTKESAQVIDYPYVT